jgi:hypothetical protein
MEGRGRNLILRYYHSLEGLRKIMKILSQNSRSPDRYLKLGPPEYEAGIARTRNLPFPYLFQPITV